MIEAGLLLDELARTPGSLGLLVVGPAGSGKTWLLDEMAAGVGDAVVARTGRRAGGSLAERLGVDAADAPTLKGRTVLLDDAHLLDPEAMAQLAALAETAIDADIRLVVTARPSPALGPLRLAAGRSESLGPLDPLRPTFRALVAEDADVDAVVADTGGWPELVLALSPEQQRSATLHATTEARLGAVGDRSRELAQLLAFGARVSDGSADELAGMSGQELDDALAELLVEGLLHDADAMVPLLARVVRDLTPPGRRRDLLRQVAEPSSPVNPAMLADWLRATGDRSTAAAEIFRRAAVKAPAAEAAEWLGLAVDAGADAIDDLIRAQLAAGRPAAALATVVAGSVTGTAAAAALARNGRIVDAVRALGALDEPDLSTLLEAATVLVAAGDAPGATEHRQHTDAPPVGAEAVLAALTDAGVSWLDGDPAAVRRAVDARRLADDGVDLGAFPISASTSAFVAEVASLSPQQVAPVAGQNHAFAAEEQALIAWSDLRAGRHVPVAALPDVSEVGPVALTIAAVVQAARALRVDDLEALSAAVVDALQLTDGVQPDIWLAPVLTEVLPAASRAGAPPGRLRERLDELVECSKPGSVLRLTIAFADLMAAVVNDDTDATLVHAEAIAAMPGTTTAHTLVRNAAPVFAEVLQGIVDEQQVLDTAFALRDAGLVFEGSRLTGAAALRTGDQKAAKSLLRESRAMRAERRSVGAGAGGDVTALSDREVDVARLVVQGQTHKEIGAALFISAKTVEHHVARIRNKLGASGRAEMMTAIRDYLGD